MNFYLRKTLVIHIDSAQMMYASSRYVSSSIWMAWLRHAQEKKVIIVKNNNYDAVWWSEGSMKLCGAHIV